MHIRRAIFGVIFVGVIGAGWVPASGADKAATVPATGPATTAPVEWRRVEVPKAFALRLPPDVKEQKVQGIDSLVRQWRSASIELSCDYGWYSDPLKDQDKPKYERAELAVGGKNAVVVSWQDTQPSADFPFLLGIHFPNVTGDGKVKLTVFARCRDAEGAKLAKKIFETITFP